MSKAMPRALRWTIATLLLGTIGCANNGGSSSAAPAASSAAPASAEAAAARARLRHSTGQYYVHDRGVSLARSPAPAAAQNTAGQAPAAASAAPKSLLRIPSIWSAKTKADLHPASN